MDYLKTFFDCLFGSYSTYTGKNARQCHYEITSKEKGSYASYHEYVKGPKVMIRWVQNITIKQQFKIAASMTQDLYK